MSTAVKRTRIAIRAPSTLSTVRVTCDKSDRAVCVNCVRKALSLVYLGSARGTNVDINGERKALERVCAMVQVAQVCE